MKYKKFEEKLRNFISWQRIEHSKNVMIVAGELAKIFNGDVEKAQIAGILHDCGKIRDRSKLFEMCYIYGVEVNEITRREIQLLHAPLGAKIASREFGIDDIEILDAIRYHTTGRENMTLLDKIIYIADYIEPGRSFPEVEELRKIANKNLDIAVYESLNSTIRYLITKKKYIDIEAIKARNYLLLKLEK